jgi:uncharacterized protein YukE
MSDTNQAPDVEALIDDIVTAARLTQFYDDPRFKPLAEQHWRAVDIARKTISTRTKNIVALCRHNADALEKLKVATDELQNIAQANPRKWDKEVRDQFQEWAQNRARHALASIEAMSDLAKRLRGMADGSGGGINFTKDAEYVEQLEAEIARLKAEIARLNGLILEWQLLRAKEVYGK